MAEIRFRGFVDDVLDGRTGPYGLKVTEPHRRKDGDTWVTVARTFHRVTAGYGAVIQWHRFTKGDLVSIVGKQVTDGDCWNVCWLAPADVKEPGMSNQTTNQENRRDSDGR